MEARWFCRTLTALPPEAIGTILNIGSSTLRFRTEVQPHVERQLFQPLRESGFRIVHVDLKPDEGVDLAGDLTEPGFQNELRTLGGSLLLCSNLLEHIEPKGRESLCAAMQDLVPEHGYLAVSVPFCFPHHREPIDTMFRPSPEELSGMFPALEVVKQEVVVRSGITSKDLQRRLKGCMLHLVQGVIPSRFGISSTEARLIRRSLGIWTRQHSVSCVLLKRSGRPQNHANS